MFIDPCNRGFENVQIHYCRVKNQSTLNIVMWGTDMELCAYLKSGPVRKQLSCQKRILLDRRTTTGHWGKSWLSLTLPRTPWSSRTLPSATREISSGSHHTADCRSLGRHRGDSLCHQQGCPDKNWEFIKLGKILPFHGNVAAELTWMYILGDTEKKDYKIYILVWWGIYPVVLFIEILCCGVSIQRYLCG